MRIATSTIQQGGLASMLRAQAELARTQEQIATGRRVVTAADDPGAAVQIQQIERSLAANQQYATNVAVVTSRLAQEEQALENAGSTIRRVYELTLQSNNGTVDFASRKALAIEVRSRIEELMSIANRQDDSGDYLFAGTRSTAAPFARVTASVGYAGDAGSRMVQVSASQRIQDGHSGDQVFMNVRSGNGTFQATAAATNAGTGILDPGTVTNLAAWVPGNYTVEFVDPTTWRVLDAGGGVVASGNYQSGGAIAFNGAQIAISGEPAAGDSFTIAPAGFEDMFTTLDRLVAALEAEPGTPAARALWGSEMNSIIQQLTRNGDHLVNVRADVGARLSRLDAVTAAREDLELELQTSLSGLRDVDYSTAITKMNAQMVALQAAQQSYSRIAGLTLFDYL
ncbi:MAG: flagellar hook-associated protein FlgL [Sinobacteraceae bacterium]|nr:flagellar hook-associated protein FlgL [Nevskiaceae bacterium]MCP5339073.1 flagellar hook-associated protein FlgL [Nevskiaceae bacterium]MCP5359982.1 flagellar hook-associated protein FlgL [Nevskiaceae bacterium]MCP5472198.1 flagellar hook-associated protein FlgL [Nevskiaceae bacterium]